MKWFLGLRSKLKLTEFKGPARLDLVVPVYNEGELITTVYKNIASVLDNAYDWKVYFVYDFEGDITAPYLQKISNEDARIIPLLQTYGRGVLNALKFAFTKVHDGPVIVLMGDDSDDLSVIPEMLDAYKLGATVVAASRFLTKDGYIGGAWLKRNLARTAGFVLNKAGLGTNDPTNNFKLYSGRYLKATPLESKGGFEIALELTVKAATQGFVVTQIAGSWKDRVQGKSNFKLYSWMPEYLRWFMYYFFHKFVHIKS